MKYITENDRIYVDGSDGEVIAEITFKTNDGVTTIDHTFVDNSLRRQGVAAELVQMAVNKIIADGNQIAATCPYALKWLRQHPEYKIVDTEDTVS